MPECPVVASNFLILGGLLEMAQLLLRFPEIPATALKRQSRQIGFDCGGKRRPIAKASPPETTSRPLAERQCATRGRDLTRRQPNLCGKATRSIVFVQGVGRGRVMAGTIFRPAGRPEK